MDDKLIVALDVETFEEARGLVDSLSDVVNVFKVGSQLFTACGPVIVRYIQAQGKKVFLDLKYHDIPNTVANAISSAVHLSVPGHNIGEEGNLQTDQYQHLLMCTVHTVGGEEMLMRAVEAAQETSKALNVTKPLIVGITVLTSEEKTDSISDLILERTQLARQCRLDGVVASAQEAELLRREFGKDFVIVTPGIRPAGADVGDQKRVTTPKEAIDAGSSFLVVGRPIVAAHDPLEAAKAIVAEITS